MSFSELTCASLYMAYKLYKNEMVVHSEIYQENLVNICMEKSSKLNEYEIKLQMKV